MSWLVAGFGYSAAYAIAVAALAAHPLARLWVGNLGLLVSPLVPIVVLLRRRGDFNGRPRLRGLAGGTRGLGLSRARTPSPAPLARVARGDHADGRRAAVGGARRLAARA